MPGVQDGPASMYQGGSWTCRARFGTAAVGVGERFLVRVLATESTLAPGPLTEIPKDAVISKSIVVMRKK